MLTLVGGASGQMLTLVGGASGQMLMLWVGPQGQMLTFVDRVFSLLFLKEPFVFWGFLRDQEFPPLSSLETPVWNFSANP